MLECFHKDSMMLVTCLATNSVSLIGLLVMGPLFQTT